MNTRDIAQQKAHELLIDLGIPVNSVILTPDGPITALAVGTSAFLQGWVWGLRDAKAIREHTGTDAKDSYVSLLRRQAG